MGGGSPFGGAAGGSPFGGAGGSPFGGAQMPDMAKVQLVDHHSGVPVDRPLEEHKCQIWPKCSWWITIRGCRWIALWRSTNARYGQSAAGGSPFGGAGGSPFGGAQMPDMA